MKNWITAIAMTAAATAAFCYAPFMGGCATTNTKAVDPLPKIEQAQRGAKPVADGLPKRADKIDENAKAIQERLSKELVAKLLSYFTNITVETEGLRIDAKQLQQVVADLQTAHGQVEDLKAANGRLDGQVKKLEDEKKNESRKLMAAIIWMSVIGIGVCVALFAGGWKDGLFGVMGCGATLAVAYALQAHGYWIALGAGVVLVVGLGLLVYRIVSTNKIAEELVDTVSVVKAKLRPGTKKSLFKSPSVSGVQSDITEAFVKKVERKAKPKPVAA